MKNFTKNYTPVRILMMLFSMLPMGVAVGLFEMAAFGNNPFSSMGMALSSFAGISFGTMTLIINIVLFAVQLWLGRHLFNIGTVINMVVVGYIAELTMFVFSLQPDLTGRVILLAVSVLVLSLGASLYFTADLGVAPYDAMAFIIQKYSKWKYWVCRVITDVICVAICIAFGGIFGVGTIISALCLGPFISFFNKNISEKIIAAGEKKN